MILLLSFCSLKLFREALFGSLPNLAAISKSEFPKVNSLLARDILPFTNSTC